MMNYVLVLERKNTNLIKNKMENAVENLKVPFKCDVALGRSWEKQKMSDEYNSGGAYKAMLKLFEAKLEMEKEKYIPKPEHQCLRCKDEREVWVWKDTSESEKSRIANVTVQPIRT